MKRILLFLLLSTLTFGQAWKWDAFQPTTKYGWSVNLDGSSEYASVTPSLRLTGKYSLRDDFSVDGMTGVANRGWVVGSGSYTVNNLVDNPLSANDYALVCQTAGVISIPSNMAYGKVSFDWYKGGNDNIFHAYFMNSTNEIATNNGYLFRVNASEPVVISKVTNGGLNAIMASANSYISNSTWYHIDIYRNTNGSFSVYLNNVLVSTTGGSGQNPVLDNTYNSSNYFVLDLDAGDRISSIVCEYGEGSLDLNSHEKFKFSFDRDMEKANNWVGVSNHSVTDSVTTDKHSGTYSLAMTSSGAGGVGSYIDLPSAYFTVLVVGEKYTLEFWAKATNATCTLTVVIGSKSKSFAVSNSAWTKCVFNFQATENEVGQMIKLYANQADVVYLDDFSLTQAYDYLVNCWFNTGASIGNERLFVLANASQSQILNTTSSNVNSFTLSDATSTVATSSTAYIVTNVFYLSSTIVNRTGNAQVYKNGVVDGSAQSVVNVGRILPLTNLYVGYSGSGNYFSGYIGEIQIVKFSDISTSNVNPLSIYKNGIPKGYAGGTTVAYYKWKGTTDAEMLRDWSGSGNSLSGVNVSQAGDQVRGTYKSK